MPASSAFLAAAALSVGLQLRAEYRGPRWQVYLFKPSTTALLLLLAADDPNETDWHRVRPSPGKLFLVDTVEGEEMLFEAVAAPTYGPDGAQIGTVTVITSSFGGWFAGALADRYGHAWGRRRTVLLGSMGAAASRVTASRETSGAAGAITGVAVESVNSAGNPWPS